MLIEFINCNLQDSKIKDLDLDKIFLTALCIDNFPDYELYKKSYLQINL